MRCFTVLVVLFCIYCGYCEPVHPNGRTRPRVSSNETLSANNPDLEHELDALLDGHVFLTDPNAPFVPRDYSDRWNERRIFGRKAQCMCGHMKMGHYTGCLSYNTAYQAANIIEAIKNFRDMTNPDDGNERGPGRIIFREDIPQSTYRCQYRECRSCMDKLVDLFERKKWLDERAARNMRYLLGVREGDQDEEPCDRFNFDRKFRSFRSEESNSDVEDLADELKDEGSNEFGSKKRKPENLGKVYLESGTRFFMHCMKRGEPLNSDGVVQTCDVCWAWRELPMGYHPRIVNELVCHPLTDKCLSGWGGCKQQYTNFPVYRKTGPRDTDVETVTVSVATGCSCHVGVGSPIEKLIEG